MGCSLRDFEHILKKGITGLHSSSASTVLGIYKLIFIVVKHLYNPTRGCSKISLSSLAFVVICGILDGSHSAELLRYLLVCLFSTFETC